MLVGRRSRDRFQSFSHFRHDDEPRICSLYVWICRINVSDLGVIRDNRISKTGMIVKNLKGINGVMKMQIEKKKKKI